MEILIWLGIKCVSTGILSKFLQNFVFISSEFVNLDNIDTSYSTYFGLKNNFPCVERFREVSMSFIHG